MIAMPSFAEARAGLQGEIDNVSPYRVRGWARNPQLPDEPVVLLIANNGEVLERVVADRARDDLLQAGFSSSHHGFDVWLPARLDASRRNIVRVFREIDGADLFRSPVILEASEAFGPVLQARLTTLLATPMEAPELRERIEFLVDLVEGLRRRLADEHAIGRGREAEEEPLRALVIDDQLPDSRRDAGSMAILSHIRSLGRLGYEISFVPSDLDGVRSLTADALTAEGMTLHLRPHTSSVEEVLRREANTFDLVYIHRYTNAAKYGPLARSFQPTARLVFSVADLHHLRLQRQGEYYGSERIAADSQLIRLRELSAAWSASSVITHSTHEAELLKADLGRTPIAVVPWSVTPRPVVRPFDRRRGVAFVGSFMHAPNLDAARRLVHAIMPRVWSTEPDIPCFLIGSDMPDELAGLNLDGIEVLGHVPDLFFALNRVRLSVAPLAWGAGIKGKVLESFAHGVPCAMTGIAAEGICLPAALDVCLGDSDEALALAIVTLHQDEALNRRCAEAGLALIEDGWSELRVDAAMRRAIIGSEPNLKLPGSNGIEQFPR